MPSFFKEENEKIVDLLCTKIPILHLLREACYSYIRVNPEKNEIGG